MKVVGKILWWDGKDKNGIIVDAIGNEYYFDISVIEGRQDSNLKPGAVVQFKKNESITKVSCAMSVYLPPRKSKERLEREFQRNLQLALPL
jgi:cold shock CspA family protein